MKKDLKLNFFPGQNLNQPNQFLKNRDYLSQISLLRLGEFKGTMPGCLCGETLYKNSCRSMKTESSPSHSGGLGEVIVNFFLSIIDLFKNSYIDKTCNEIPAIEKIPYYIWKNTLFCGENLNMNYLDFSLVSKNQKCKTGYKNCGIIDNKLNMMCIPEKYDCPMDSLEFSEIKDFIYNEPYYKSLRVENDIKDAINITNILNESKIIFEKKEISHSIKAFKAKRSSQNQEFSRMEIFNKFIIKEDIPCLKKDSLNYPNSDFYLKISKQDNPIMQSNSTNVQNNIINKKLNNFKILKYKNNLNLGEEDYLYKSYNLFNEDRFEMCYRKTNLTDNDLKNNFYLIDKSQIKDLYYQNQLLNKIIDLPKFPKQNLLYNTTLYHYSYSGMNLDCRDSLLNMINYNTVTFIEYMKNIEKYFPPNTLFYIIATLLIICVIFDIMFYFAEIQYCESSNKSFMQENSETRNLFRNFKIFEGILLIASYIYFRCLDGEMIFNPQNNYDEINQMGINGKKENILNDQSCYDDKNFQLINIFYQKHYTVCLYNTLFLAISIYVIVYAMIRLLTESKEEYNSINQSEEKESDRLKLRNNVDQ